MFGQPLWSDPHRPDASIEWLRAACFARVHSEFLNLPTTGRAKGRFAIIAEAV